VTVTQAALLVHPCGDRALSLRVAANGPALAGDKIIALAQSLREDPLNGVVETVPTCDALLVIYDPQTVPFAHVRAGLEDRFADLPDQALIGRMWDIPVVYGGDVGVDLDALAHAKHMSRDALITLHASATYSVYMAGGAPGFAYLGGLPEVLHAPRLAVPRPRVEAGAVGIGGRQAAVTSAAGPSGWRYIGQTPVCLLDQTRDDPILMRAGDRVRFYAVSAADGRQMARTKYAPEPRVLSAP
jgi:KipI family sensor histidine kinase inhibitor